jgi:hypothetical protein
LPMPVKSPPPILVSSDRTFLYVIHPFVGASKIFS